MGTLWSQGSRSKSKGSWMWRHSEGLQETSDREVGTVGVKGEVEEEAVDCTEAAAMVWDTEVAATTTEYTILTLFNLTFM